MRNWPADLSRPPHRPATPMRVAGPSAQRHRGRADLRGSTRGPPGHRVMASQAGLATPAPQLTRPQPRRAGGRRAQHQGPCGGESPRAAGGPQQAGPEPFAPFNRDQSAPLHSTDRAANRASAVLAVVVLRVFVVVGTLTGPLGRLSATRLAVVPAAGGSGADLPPAVCQREADLRRKRRVGGAEVGEEGVPTRSCHDDAILLGQALGCFRRSGCSQRSHCGRHRPPCGAGYRAGGTVLGQGRPIGRHHADRPLGGQRRRYLRPRYRRARVALFAAARASAQPSAFPTLIDREREVLDSSPAVKAFNCTAAMAASGTATPPRPTARPSPPPAAMASISACVRDHHHAGCRAGGDDGRDAGRRTQPRAGREPTGVLGVGLPHRLLPP